ncbi:hypothetical protein [Paracoccus sp. Ld10]|uniref:hypothetical protein n=1 Tax=Paracoccus sp. Ld10 TaxID=649158 RepID=UPI0038635530
MKLVDVPGDGVFSLLARLPKDRPDQLQFDALGKFFHHLFTMAVPAPTDRDQDVTFADQSLMLGAEVTRSARVRRRASTAKSRF